MGGLSLRRLMLSKRMHSHREKIMVQKRSMRWKIGIGVLTAVGLAVAAIFVRLYLAFSYSPGEMPRNREVEARLRPCDAGKEELVRCAAREGLFVKVFEPPLPDERAVMIALPDIVYGNGGHSFERYVGIYRSQKIFRVEIHSIVAGKLGYTGTHPDLMTVEEREQEGWRKL